MCTITQLPNVSRYRTSSVNLLQKLSTMKMLAFAETMPFMFCCRQLKQIDFICFGAVMRALRVLRVPKTIKNYCFACQIMSLPYLIKNVLYEKKNQIMR